MTAKLVYFMKPVGMDGPIKIGCSIDPAVRLATVALWSPIPLEIVAAVDGSYQDEDRLHTCFANSHSHREWFHATPALVSVIDRLNSGESIAAVLSGLVPEGKIRKGKPTGASAWSDASRLAVKQRAAARRAAKMAGAA